VLLTYLQKYSKISAMNGIVQNALKISQRGKKPVFIVSTHTHDFASFRYGSGDNDFLAIDGGKEYVRRAGDFQRAKELGIKVEEFNLNIKDDLNRIKARLLWGTFGPEGKGPFRIVRLRDCSTRHLRLIRKHRYGQEDDLYDRTIRAILRERRK
jgi:hypothetical protein